MSPEEIQTLGVQAAAKTLIYHCTNRSLYALVNVLGVPPGKVAEALGVSPGRISQIIAMAGPTITMPFLRRTTLVSLLGDVLKEYAATAEKLAAHRSAIPGAAALAQAKLKLATRCYNDEVKELRGLAPQLDD
jgi:hypothetical protein